MRKAIGCHNIHIAANLPFAYVSIIVKQLGIIYTLMEPNALYYALFKTPLPQRK